MRTARSFQPTKTTSPPYLVKFIIIRNLYQIIIYRSERNLIFNLGGLLDCQSTNQLCKKKRLFALKGTVSVLSKPHIYKPKHLDIFHCTLSVNLNALENNYAKLVLRLIKHHCR